MHGPHSTELDAESQSRLGLDEGQLHGLSEADARALPTMLRGHVRGMRKNV